MNKLKILVFNKFYLPGFKAGGPIRTVANMTDRLGDEFDFYIVTLDHDSGESMPYSGMHYNQWNIVRKANVMYVNEHKISLAFLSKIYSELSPDLIYLNSFFDPTFTQRILWARRKKLLGTAPIIIAPRGEFSVGALKLKWFKKKLYLWISYSLDLYRKLIWQASSEHERADILRSMSFVSSEDILVAMDLAPINNAIPSHHVRKIDGVLRICFLSRISPMKNLDFALNILMGVKSKVLFTIYGPKSDPKYWLKCQSIVEQLPSNISVCYEGEINHVDVKDRLSQHDLFFLPTRGENYGHVIHEALSAGLPVLISDQTPWNEVTERGVGWALPLDNPSGFARIIDEVSTWDAECLARVRTLAVEFAREKSDDSAVLQANRDLFTAIGCAACL